MHLLATPSPEIYKCQTLAPPIDIPRRFGILGELKLGELCSQSSMVSNPAKRDVYGFDNLVQLNFDHNAVAHDLVPAPTRAYVQAKATQKKSGSIGVRLTNWQHMIADPEPWFVFVCEVSATREVTDVYLVHINEHWMEKALRRLRKYSARGKPLGDREMVVTYGQSDRLQRIHGEVLRQRIRDAIGDDAEAYRERKKRFYATCGYSADAHRVTVRFPKKPMNEHYLDWTNVSLGLMSDLNVEHIKVMDQRFGEAIVKLESQGGKLSIRVNPIQSAQLQLFNDKYGNLSTRVDFFSTFAIPQIPTELSKVRMRVGPFSLYVDTGKSVGEDNNTCSLNSRLSWDFDEQCALSKMGDGARAMRLLCRAGTRVSLTVSDCEPPSVDFCVSNPSTLSDGLKLHLFTVEAVAAVGRYVGLETMELASRVLESILMPAALAGGIVQGSPEFNIICPAAPVAKSKKPVLVVSCGFPLGDWVLFACGALPLRQKSKDGFKFTTERAQNFGVWKVSAERAKDFPILERQAEAIERLEKNAALHVFSIDPRTDNALRRLTLGAAADEKSGPRELS